MTKEEKNAIEYFKNRIDICLDNANDCEEMDFDEEAAYLRKEAIKIETVLNLIQKQQEEIREAKEHNRQLSIELGKRYKQIEQYINLLATDR